MHILIPLLTPFGELVRSNLSGTTWPFTLPTFDEDPTKLYVYSDFLESGFSDYSWNLSNQLGSTIKTNFHNGSGIFFSTSRRINSRDYQNFNLVLQTKDPQYFVLRFKSWDNQLSDSFPLKNGDNIISTHDINLDSLSAILIESTGNIPDPISLTLDNLYFSR